MKHTGLLASGGAVVGFAGVLLLHSQLPRSALTGQAGVRQAATHAAGPIAPVSPAASGAARSTAGASEQYGYGVLAVQVTVRGSRITNVSVPTLQTADPLSQQIADQAIPILRSEVLSAQSARIDAVSGATYTSEAYATSLQSALGKLHVK